MAKVPHPDPGDGAGICAEGGQKKEKRTATAARDISSWITRDGGRERGGPRRRACSDAKKQNARTPLLLSPAGGKEGEGRKGEGEEGRGRLGGAGRSKGGAGHS